MCAPGLRCPQDRYSEYEICAAGAARVNLGVYYMPGQLQYRQPQTVLAQYLRQSLLNGTFVNVNLVQQVLINSLEQSCKSRAGACFAVPALCQTWQPLHGQPSISVGTASCDLQAYIYDFSRHGGVLLASIDDASALCVINCPSPLPPPPLPPPPR